MTDEQKVREQFEAWGSSMFLALGRKPGDGAYKSSLVENMWDAWQAAVSWMSGGEAVAWRCTHSDKSQGSLLTSFRSKAERLSEEGMTIEPLYIHPPRAAEDARDAARYRELFNGPYPFCFDGETYDTKAEADQAIDQAIAGKRGGVE